MVLCFAWYIFRFESLLDGNYSWHVWHSCKSSRRVGTAVRAANKCHAEFMACIIAISLQTFDFQSTRLRCRTVRLVSSEFVNRGRHWHHLYCLAVNRNRKFTVLVDKTLYRYFQIKSSLVANGDIIRLNGT